MGIKMSKHEPSMGATDEWYTPKYIFDALNCRFDVDVASPGAAIVPWIPAQIHLTKIHDFLCPKMPPLQPETFIWMNPPYGGRNGLVPWLEKFVEHKNGICLVPDRTSAPWWQFLASRADKILFVSPKIKFISGVGMPANQPSNGSCLVAMGEQGINALRHAATNYHMPKTGKSLGIIL